MDGFQTMNKTSGCQIFGIFEDGMCFFTPVRRRKRKKIRNSIERGTKPKPEVN